jgi:FtsP/CotA-like multicopper oxidase with cupredoxin domain
MDGMDMEGMEGMGMPSSREPLGSDTGDVTYPFHLINGKVPGDPFVVTSKPGRRIRFRLINGGSDTAYRFAVGGHRLQVTHADGFPVRPVDVDTLILGMGERYDVTVTVADGVFPIVAVPEGKDDPPAMGVLRSASGRTPPAGSRPKELKRRLLSYADLVPTEPVALDARAPDRVVDMSLQMAGKGRRWLIDGRAFGDHEPIRIESDERVRLRMDNKSMMFHPMHVHGHTFAVVGRGHAGFRKDTVNVLPMQKLEIDLQADNPGQWLVHCHNVYHGELGMMTVLSYTE